MNKKMYSVSIKGNGICWEDNYQVYAPNKEEAKKLAIKQWQEEHKPKIIDVSEYFEEIC